MKRLSLYLFLILFTLPTPSQADDIRDFQIEGMSVGDSLLDYFSESEIKNTGKKYYPGDKKFFNIFYNNLPQFKVYDQIQILLKTGDKKYEIHGITGAINFKNNLTDCLKKKEEIASELSEFLKDIIKRRSDRKGEYANDTKSVYYASEFYFLNKAGGARVLCNDWSNNRRDVKVSIDTAEVIYWLTNEAWK
jgi:hypothetical protein